MSPAVLLPAPYATISSRVFRRSNRCVFPLNKRARIDDRFATRLSLFTTASQARHAPPFGPLDYLDSFSQLSPPWKPAANEENKSWMLRLGSLAGLASKRLPSMIWLRRPESRNRDFIAIFRAKKRSSWLDFKNIWMTA